MAPITYKADHYLTGVFVSPNISVIVFSKSLVNKNILDISENEWIEISIAGQLNGVFFSKENILDFHEIMFALHNSHQVEKSLDGITHKIMLTSGVTHEIIQLESGRVFSTYPELPSQINLFIEYLGFEMFPDSTME